MTLSAADLDSPWPPFLDLMDSDPRGVVIGLHEFGYGFIAARRPKIYGSLTREEREDLVPDVVQKLCKEDFSGLRKFKPIGMRFRDWFATVLYHAAIDVLRRRRRMVSIEVDRVVEPPDGDEILAARLERSKAKLSEECRFLVECKADGLKARHIAVLKRMPTDEESRKKISREVQKCCKCLRDLLQADDETQRRL